MFAASKSGQSTVAATDPYFKYVPLLLETTTTNGQQNNTFLDSSTNNFTITRNGTPTQGSVTPYWPDGYWSNYFNGSSDYLTAPNNAALALGAGDFTVEFWAFVLNSSGAYIAVDSRNAGSDAGFAILFETSSGYNVRVYRNGAYLLTSSAVVTTNAWNHVAFVRNGATSYLYLNGVQVASAADANTYVEPGTLKIGVGWNTVNYFPGYISNLRIVKGTAVYTSAFTPPTTPLTAITNTSLLTCQSNRFKDNSTNNFAITAAGTPKVQAFQPFSPPASYTTAAYGGSGYFNGSSDYLTAPANTAFAFGTGDFTVEAWLYTTSRIGSGNFGSQIAGCQIYGVSADWLFCLTAGGLLYFQITSSITGAYVSTSTVPLNAWTHVAFVRASGVVKAFINGVDAGNSGTYATSITNASTSFSVGGASNGSANSLLQGYISNLRIVKGTAVYSANFTPPTAPVTAITNTSLLTNFTNAGIYDAAAQNNQITVGSAQASTTISPKWGVTSMKFNGTTDYLNPPSNPAFAFGTGDFTLECWIYATAASDSAIYEGRAAGSGTAGFTLTAFSSSVIRIYTGAAVLIASSGTTYLNQWTHVAVVRASGTTTLYINGTSVGTSAGMGNLTDTTPLIGAGRYTGLTTPSSFFTGYLQDFRVTKGYARYTANFTPPTAAFPTR